MKIISADELKKIKELSANQAKSGSRKEAKTIILDLIKSNKGKAIEVTPADVKPNFSDGFTEGLLMELSEECGVAIHLPKATQVKALRKGKEVVVPRYASAVIEC
jgi:hypothetical protein